MKKLVSLAIVSLILAGCTDADTASISSYGSKFRITVWSGGQAVKVYTSTGRPETVAHSDGWEFKDKASGKFIRVSGTITIEEID